MESTAQHFTKSYLLAHDSIAGAGTSREYTDSYTHGLPAPPAINAYTQVTHNIFTMQDFYPNIHSLAPKIESHWDPRPPFLSSDNNRLEQAPVNELQIKNEVFVEEIEMHNNEDDKKSITDLTSMETVVEAPAKNKIMFECTECPFKTKYRSSLKKHINSMHTNEMCKPFKCDLCSYSSTTNYNLKLHHTSKHIGGDRPFKCTSCEYSTAYKSSLARHMTEAHICNKSIKCDSCTFVTNRLDRLEKHRESKHSLGDRSHRCTLCSFSTAYKQKLKLHHARKHANAPPV